MKVLILCLGILMEIAWGQERIRRALVGPRGDQTRVVVTFTDPEPDGYRLKSMTIDITPVKDKNEEPSVTNLDLTSTTRSLTTGAKDQKILIMRWQRPGTLEVKCDSNWKPQTSSPELDNIVATTRAVLRNASLDARKPTEFSLSSELEQKISSILDSLNTENYPCLRSLQ